MRLGINGMARVAGWLATVAAWGGSFAMADPTDENRRDIHSHGRPDQVRVRHVSLDLSVDFADRRLSGSATLRFERQPGAPADAPLVLDAKGLTIQAVEGQDDAGWSPRAYQIGPADPILGSAITIPTAQNQGQIRITYRTAPQAGALQWLDPARTAGGKQPFLFTQSEAIQCRTWIPLQDSPGVRITYDATIRVPSGLTVVMAADPVVPRGPDPTVFRFAMPQAIPSYLIALAVGDLAFQPLGPRTGVWAEPALLARSAYEFADTEAMIAATEKRFGPYRWGRYDLLVLPPSFPFGGMENPKLTFATPTILAGDRSLVALVAHELAHSWSGNLVTNATWSDFWLNEGFTVYLERRIIEDVYGPARARIEAVLGVQELREELTRLEPRDQILHIGLAGRDPDDAMTQVAYEKGALFLAELERAFGRPRFDAFLLAYFDAHAFQSITTADFVADLRGKLFPLDPTAAAKIDVRAWTEDPGLKVAFTEPKSERLDLVDQTSADWIGGRLTAGNLETKVWTTQEWLRFLRAVPEQVSAARLGELDAAFGLTQRQNSEIAAQWLLMAARAGYRPADGRTEAFLTAIGRRKFIVPLYRELMKTAEGANRAKAIYARARPFYHPIAVDSVDKIVGRP